MDSKLHIAKGNNKFIFTKLRIIKNLSVISCTFVLLFSAYDGLSMLQSTMNGKQGIGSASQAVVYFTFAVSSLLLPKYTIKKLGCKMTLFVGTVLYLPYIAANVYPTWITMMSSAVLIGLGAGILWAAQCTYFNEAAGIYCKLVEDCKQGKKDKNFELFVIQNGINENMVSKPGIKSEGIVLSQDYCEMLIKDCIADSKCSSVKIVSESNHCIKEISNYSKINREKETELGVRNNRIQNVFDKQPTRDTLINSVNNIKAIEQLENTNSELEDSVLKDFLKYTENEKELTMNNQIASALHSPIVNKNMPSTKESLNNKIISENPLQFGNLESITALFFGCFGMMYYTAQVWSNLISYYVLNVNSEDNVTVVSNFSCGAGFCKSEFEVISSSTDEISSSTRYLLIGITVTLSVISSLLVLIFLDPLDSGEEGEVTFSLSHAMATFNHLRKKEQLFIIPLSMFSGLAQGFYTADFTKSYIQCAWSISYVGLVSAFFGLACGISSTISGCLVRYVGRIPVVLVGLGLHLGIDVFLMLWNPNQDNHFMIYVAAALWGVKVGIFWSQIQAFYGLLFKNDEEAAFATHYFCSAMGWTLSFAYSDYLCTSTKIYILMVMCCMGTLGYLAADRSFRRRKTQ